MHLKYISLDKIIFNSFFPSFYESLKFKLRAFFTPTWRKITLLTYGQPKIFAAKANMFPRIKQIRFCSKYI